MIAFNRDEDLDREAGPLGFVAGCLSIVCGLRKATGTAWMALNKVDKDLAVLKNFTTPRNKQPGQHQTRGILILKCVKIRDPSIDKSKKMFQSINEYKSKVFEPKYRGFNLIYGNVMSGEFKYYQHQNEEEDQKRHQESDGSALKERPRKRVCLDELHGMSNAGSNLWGKVDRGELLFKAALDQAEHD